jgi:hypothetical protein
MTRLLFCIATILGPTVFANAQGTAAQATEHRDALPKAITGSWCREIDEDDWALFTKFDGPPAPQGQFTLSTGEIVYGCPNWMLWLGTKGYSQSGELCDFEKIEETAPNIYLVHAHCRGQSGVEGSWNAIMEFEMIGRHLVITHISEG